MDSQEKAPIEEQNASNTPIVESENVNQEALQPEGQSEASNVETVAEQPEEAAPVAEQEPEQTAPADEQ